MNTSEITRSLTTLFSELVDGAKAPAGGNFVLNSGDVCVVQSGGTALDTIVNNGAVLRVSGGVASGALVNNGGVETIADGSDIGTTVNSGGLYITRRPSGSL